MTRIPGSFVLMPAFVLHVASLLLQDPNFLVSLLQVLYVLISLILDALPQLVYLFLEFHFH